MIGGVWDPNFDGLTSGLRTIQVSTRSGHEMVLDLQHDQSNVAIGGINPAMKLTVAA